MSLKKNDPFVIISTVLFILAAACILFYEPFGKNALNGFATDSFSVSVFINHLSFVPANRIQLDPAVTSGDTVRVTMPVLYYNNETVNVSVAKPAGFECGYNWSINESGNIKPVDDLGSQISWEADKSVKDTSINFVLDPPIVTQEVEQVGNNYAKSAVITSCAHLLNVSVNISVSSNYTGYSLYLYENNTPVDKTAEYHLDISGDRAYFHGFNLSNKTFVITGIGASSANQSNPPAQVHSSGGSGGHYSQPAQEIDFLVEPSELSVMLTSNIPLETSLTVFNKGSEGNHISINFTRNFIVAVEPNEFNLAKDGFLTVKIRIDPSKLEPGNYMDDIIFFSQGHEQDVKVKLAVKRLQARNIEDFVKHPAQEMPLPESSFDTLPSQPPQSAAAAPEKTTFTLFMQIAAMIILFLSIFLIIFMHKRSEVYKFRKRKFD